MEYFKNIERRDGVIILDIKRAHNNNLESNVFCIHQMKTNLYNNFCLNKVDEISGVRLHL
jgi:hypothetical protein